MIFKKNNINTSPIEVAKFCCDIKKSSSSHCGVPGKFIAANSLHPQLRLGRSFLSAHGFAIGIDKSNLCICLRPETTRHFFTCFLYQEEQKPLYENVSKQIPKFST